MIHGPILTQCSSLDQVADCIRRGNYTALKVVTGWGAPNGWTRDAIIHATQLVPTLVVRTVAGDPSYGGGQKSVPDRIQALTELMPWYGVRPDIIIEIGNEPNIRPDWSEDFCWLFRWHLDQTITACRAAFPKAKLIAPAPILDQANRPDRWLAICGDVMKRCDYIGLHVYEFDAFLRSEQRHGSTGQLQRGVDLYSRLFGDKQWLLTEYGINDPGTPNSVKGARYARMLRHGVSTPVLPHQVVGGFWYHFCADRSLQAEYDISGAGDLAYRRAWEAT